MDPNKYCVPNNLVPAINILADFLSQIMFGKKLFAALTLHNITKTYLVQLEIYTQEEFVANNFCRQYKCMRNSTALSHWLTCISVFSVLLIAFGRFPSTMTTFTQGSYTCMRFTSLSNPTKSARPTKLQTNENNCIFSVRVWSFVKLLQLIWARDLRVEAAFWCLQRSMCTQHIYLLRLVRFNVRWTYFLIIQKLLKFQVHEIFYIYFIFFFVFQRFIANESEITQMIFMNFL